MNKTERETSALESAKPFEEERALSVGDMEIELWTDSINFRGSLDITPTGEGLARARALANFLTRTVTELENMPLEENAISTENGAGHDGEKEDQADLNKFGKAFD